MSLRDIAQEVDIHFSTVSNKKAGVKLTPTRVDIPERPQVVENRARIGDWEGDTVHGQNVHLVTLVDRASRFTLAKRVLRKTKEFVADAMLELHGKFRGLSCYTGYWW